MVFPWDSPTMTLSVLLPQTQLQTLGPETYKNVSQHTILIYQLQ